MRRSTIALLVALSTAGTLSLLAVACFTDANNCLTDDSCNDGVDASSSRDSGRGTTDASDASDGDARDAGDAGDAGDAASTESSDAGDSGEGGSADDEDAGDAKQGGDADVDSADGDAAMLDNVDDESARRQLAEASFRT